MRVLIFGDSITQGFYDEKGGWATRLVNQYLEKEVAGDTNVPTLFNLGISGDTTQNLLDRFEAEAGARIYKGNNNALVFAIGTNDTIYRGNDVDSTPEEYRQKLSNLVDMARAYTDKLLFVSLFPVIDELLQPFPWSSSGKCYSTERMKLFNDTLTTLCKDNDLSLVDAWSDYERHSDLKSLFFDGIHPNSEGHQIIADLVKPDLEKVLSN